MSCPRTASRTVAVVAALLIALAATPAAAAPLADQTAADRAALQLALERYQAAEAESAEVDARVSAASSELDALIAEEQACQSRLQARAAAIYRSGDSTALSLVLGAASIPDLVSRLELIERMARQDAGTIEALKTARAETARSAEDLLALQEEQARALEALAAEVEQARAELARSEAALAEYEAKIAAAKKAAASKTSANTPDQQLTGSGEWQSAVASHYGINFTGRGASGEQIGPYSMIVAHRTLPFGTLIEFEYNGRRAVARVADRGPHVAGREFDLGPGVARVLGFNGVHEVRYRLISR